MYTTSAEGRAHEALYASLLTCGEANTVCACLFTIDLCNSGDSLENHVHTTSGEGTASAKSRATQIATEVREGKHKSTQHAM